MSKQLKIEENCFRLIASMVTDILFQYDIKNDRMMNSKCKNGVFGKGIYVEHPQKALLKYVHPADREFFLKFMKEMQEGKSEVYVELRTLMGSKEYHWFVFEGKTIRRYGIPELVIGRAKILEKRNAEEERVYQPDEQDMLTKVMKRSCINELLELYFQTSPEGKAALLVLDIDDFATINASMGHFFGDEVLVNAANAIASKLGVADLLGRVGGDKFLICIKDIEDREVAKKKAEQILQVLHALYIGEYQFKPLSASIGIAIYPENGTDYSSLYNLAVKALHEVKANGKNAWCIGTQETAAEKENEELPTVQGHYTTFDKGEKEEFDRFGYELAEVAFRLMEEDIDVESVINLLIRKVADHYDLSAVCIREITNHANGTRVSYEYLRKDYTNSELGKESNMSDEQWNLFVHKYRNGYYLYEKQDGEKPEGVEKYKIPKDLQTMLQIPIYRNMNFAGSIDCCDAYTKRAWSKTEISTLKMFARIVSGYLINMRDYQGTTALMEQMQERDEVTGLYRYDTFLKKLKTELTADNGGRIALVYSDIKHFKYINENFEYEVGNRLLRRFADAMVENAAQTYLFGSRVYSDNIIAAVQLPEAMTVEELCQSVRRFNQRFISEVQVQFIRSSLNINSGIYLVKPGDEAKHAVSNANLARKTAKENADGIPVVFCERMIEEINRQMQLISSLPAAITNKELVVYFQPKVACATGKLVGAEALVRWRKKNGGFYYPDEFVPLFEKNGSIVEVDYYVYRETFAWLKQRLVEGKAVVPISMNVSRIHLMDEVFLHYVDALLAEYQIPPRLVEFELTESICINNMENALYLVQQLRDRGLKVAMDDFGSGYSSLNMLHQLPIDVLKLDKMFLSRGTLEEGNKIILSCVVEMAKRLRITALCEGVENEEQSEFLRQIGCDEIQGYYYGRPMPIEEFEVFMEQEK